MDNNCWDHEHHYRRTLLLIAALLATNALLCQAQNPHAGHGAMDTMAVSETSLSFSFSSGDPALPCVHRGVPYMSGDSWKTDVCTTCTCDNATTTCVIESCQPAFCPEPIKPVGECCFYCPFNIKVKDVIPTITSEGAISEGGENRLTLDVQIKFQEARDTTGVSGEDLWTLSAWVSPNEDGRGTRLGYQSNTLDGTQKGQTYTKKKGFKFSPVDFSFNDPMAECDDMKYICTRIDKASMPVTSADLPFQFSGFPDESALTGCTEAPQCQGIVARDIDWNLEPLETVIPGKATSVGIDTTVFFRENNPELSGEGLWRMGTYGSRYAEGMGERFNYVSQTLNVTQQGATLNEGSSLQLSDVQTMFELGSVGCNGFGYVCVEFTGGDEPEPYYFFRREGAEDTSRAANTITKCKEQQCSSKAIFSDLAVNLGDQTLIENKNNPLTVDLTAVTTNESTNVIGENLWTIAVYGSQNPFGSGPKKGLVEQMLNPTAAATSLNEGEDLFFQGVSFDFDMTGIGCKESSYLCFDLDKNPRASMNYIFDSRPDDSVTTTCLDMTERCKGATARELDWIIDYGEAQFDRPTPLSLDVEVHFTPDSPTVAGQDLWKLSAFASTEGNGTGIRRDEVVQTLDSYNQAITFREGEPLEFYDIQVPFPIIELGCDDFGWFCLEFQKGERPTPEYIFETEGDGDTIISCKNHSCKGIS